MSRPPARTRVPAQKTQQSRCRVGGEAPGAGRERRTRSRGRARVCCGFVAVSALGPGPGSRARGLRPRPGPDYVTLGSSSGPGVSFASATEANVTLGPAAAPECDDLRGRGGADRAPHAAPPTPPNAPPTAPNAPHRRPPSPRRPPAPPQPSPRTPPAPPPPRPKPRFRPHPRSGLAHLCCAHVTGASCSVTGVGFSLSFLVHSSPMPVESPVATGLRRRRALCCQRLVNDRWIRRRVSSSFDPVMIPRRRSTTPASSSHASRSDTCVSSRMRSRRLSPLTRRERLFGQAPARHSARNRAPKTGTDQGRPRRRPEPWTDVEL